MFKIIKNFKVKYRISTVIERLKKKIQDGDSRALGQTQRLFKGGVVWVSTPVCNSFVLFLND